MSTDQLKIVIAMARSYNELFSRIERDVQQYGLNTSEFGVLEFLHHKGDQPVQKVAEKILVTSGTMTYVIDKLQKNGLVTRRRCEDDRRVFYVALTPKGQALIADIYPRHELFLNGLLAGMTAESTRRLIQNLADLRQSIKNSGGKQDVEENR